MPAPGFRLYLITDRKLARRGLLRCCEEALRAGAEIARPNPVAIQLREKDLGGRELFYLGLDLRELCSRYLATLIINDRIDVALEVGADGVHLGGASVDPASARRLLGSSQLIGVSTHTHDEIAAAAAAGADFAVFGPVHPPISKQAYGPSVGVAGLARAAQHAQHASIPLYALGGIGAERAAELRLRGLLGADAPLAGVAAIGAIMGSADPAFATRAILAAVM